MSVAYANKWYVSGLLSDMNVSQRRRLGGVIAERKILHVILERPYNKALCQFVEKKLVKEEVRGNNES